ncbi:DUF6498-containing protein [Halogeometricum sp. S1BR25-6]|uniref:DUF6498-containing protein n=1 Tax=Halogeometricum salsisoli TaxID=2950536 RepID=A0ABU2GAT6_9EURY|nr:DUF6498-containing protein [Halogeometricum sp. S1BR25-6]MDS0297892.1 DUF6498-containing protein [Halogeometricum sp. S1BR25-6]
MRTSFPLVGVAVWEWDLSSLLVLYWVEAFVTVLVAAAKALLAERGSPSLASGPEPLHELREKRGGWRIRPGWPPVYPRNVPVAASILGFWVVFVLPMSLLLWPSSVESVPSAGLAAGGGENVEWSTSLTARRGPRSFYTMVTEQRTREKPSPNPPHPPIRGLLSHSPTHRFCRTPTGQSSISPL